MGVIASNQKCSPVQVEAIADFGEAMPWHRGNSSNSVVPPCGLKACRASDHGNDDDDDDDDEDCGADAVACISEVSFGCQCSWYSIIDMVCHTDSTFWITVRILLYHVCDQFLPENRCGTKTVHGDPALKMMVLMTSWWV